ncbi:MAG: DUF2974 domain-containing protein [Clostridia bacterium]|nr:DUF2974 domain-containing protein [Clostridia bacterium]
MANLLDYIAWRGDLSFSDSKFCEVDGSVCSMLSYNDFGELCGGEDKTLLEAAKKRCPDLKNRDVKLGLIIPSENINELLFAAAKSRRYESVTVSDYESYTNDAETCQFAAMTFHLPGNRMAVVFRGTDDTITGWREDFCLAYLDSIPSQIRATEYLNRVAQKYPFKRIYLCGHSKGGNLTMYALAHCGAAAFAKILTAYCFDGPGLNDADFASKQYKQRERKLAVYVPQSSFIGIMFNIPKRYTVVNGVRKGAFQHDPFFWEVRGPVFEHLEGLSERGRKNEEQFRTALAKMTLAERRDFVETFFHVVESTGAKTLTELTDGGVKHLGLIVKNYGGLDKQRREMFLGLFLKLFDLKQEEKNK